MNITKLPSGSYRIKQMTNGKMYSITVPYKPSKKEAYALIQAKMEHTVAGITFKNASDQYLSAKSNILSPSTLRGYNSISRNIPEWFNALDLSAVDRFQCQKLINEYAAGHSPKSVANLNGFILAVIHLFYPDVNISLTLPKKPHKSDYIPSHDDVIALLNEAKDTEFYVGLYLAALSCRSSEICALTMDDLHGNELTINKALVRADKGFVLKPTPKTDASNRTITIPQELADRIREQGYIYRLYPLQLDKYLRRTLPKLGIPFFSLHKLRHFFCSYAHDLGYSEATIMSLGGWNSDVMKRVYRHALDQDKQKQLLAKDFSF